MTNIESIILTDDEVSEAKSIADETLRRFGGQQGHYTNTRNSHVRGKCGEIACDRWLQNNAVNVTAAFRDISKINGCDIIASGAKTLRLDVKTWDTRYWAEMGRCVAVGQIDSLRQKADAIVWCISPPVLEAGMKIDIVGWNTIDDVSRARRLMTGPKGRRQVYNHQVDQSALRSCAGLLDTLKTA